MRKDWMVYGISVGDHVCIKIILGTWVKSNVLV